MYRVRLPPGSRRTSGFRISSCGCQVHFSRACCRFCLPSFTSSGSGSSDRRATGTVATTGTFPRLSGSMTGANAQRYMPPLWRSTERAWSNARQRKLAPQRPPLPLHTVYRTFLPSLFRMTLLLFSYPIIEHRAFFLRSDNPPSCFHKKSIKKMRRQCFILT